MGVASKLARKIKPRKKTTMKSPDVKENELIYKERKEGQKLMGAGEGYFARRFKRKESTKSYESRLGQMDYALDTMTDGKMNANDVKEVLEIHNNLSMSDRRKNIREAIRVDRYYKEKNPGKDISKKILNNAGVKIENGKVVIIK